MALFSLQQDCDNKCCDAEKCVLMENATCSMGKCCDLNKCRVFMQYYYYYYIVVIFVVIFILSIYYPHN